MADVQAVSSPAEATDVFNGENVSFEEFSRYRSDGTIPERFKPAEPADPAPADAPKETAEPEPEKAEDAPESEPEETQEQPQKGSPAEKRIKQLLAQKKDLERRLAEVSKQDAKPESSPAKPQQPQYAHPKPAVDDKNADGSPKYVQYEDYVEALGRWAAKEERAQMEREYAERAALSATQKQLEDARARYEDADEIIFLAAQAIRDAKIPDVVKKVFEDSEHFVDLCYVIGEDPAELDKFIALAQSKPREALGKVFAYERQIAEELSKPKDAQPRGEDGKFKAPEKRQTAAPKPPSPVSGGTTRAFDVSDESLSPDEWMRKRTEDLARRR